MRILVLKYYLHTIVCAIFQAYRVHNKADSTQETSSRKRMKKSNKVDHVWEPSHPSTSLDIKHISPETYQRIDAIEEHLIPKQIDQRGIVSFMIIVESLGSRLIFFFVDLL